MNFLNKLAPQAHWLLRVALGSVFLFHGLTKFPALEAMSDVLGLPVFVVVLVACAEALGGALILAGGVGSGWMTRLAGLLIAPVMIGAIVTVHWGRWSFTPSETHPMGGMEFQVTLLLIALYFLIVGNGPVYSDEVAERARDGEAQPAVRVRV